MEWGVGPWRGGQRGDQWHDPWLSFGLWDPFPYCGATWDVGRGRGDRGDDTSTFARAHIDWRETDTCHIFRADLPGVRKEDLKVPVEDDNILQISGERVKEQEDQNEKWHRVERQRGSFMRRIRLPENANVDGIGCTLVDGVLTVTVPEKETPAEKRNVRRITLA